MHSSLHLIPWAHHPCLCSRATSKFQAAKRAAPSATRILWSRDLPEGCTTKQHFLNFSSNTEIFKLAPRLVLQQPLGCSIKASGITHQLLCRPRGDGCSSLSFLIQRRQTDEFSPLWRVNYAALTQNSLLCGDYRVLQGKSSKCRSPQDARLRRTGASRLGPVHFPNRVPLQDKFLLIRCPKHPRVTHKKAVFPLRQHTNQRVIRGLHFREECSW